MSTAVMERSESLVKEENLTVKLQSEMRSKVEKASKIAVKDLNLFYGEKQALYGVSLDIREKSNCFNWSFRLW